MISHLQAPYLLQNTGVYSPFIHLASGIHSQGQPSKAGSTGLCKYFTQAWEIRTEMFQLG